MWLKFAEKLIVESARFPREQIYLADYLRNPDIDYYAYKLPQYFEERNIVPPVDFDEDESYEWLESAPESTRQDFQKWIYDEYNTDNDAEVPPHGTMDFRKQLTKPEWLIHFTDAAEAIEYKGFQQGHDEMEGLHLTTNFGNRGIKGPGYNFAFFLNDRAVRQQLEASQPKYGSQAVIFKSTGVVVEHYGDEETQVIFWGPNVDPSSIYHIMKMDDYDIEREYGIDTDKFKKSYFDRPKGRIGQTTSDPKEGIYHSYVLTDATGRVRFISNDVNDIASWIDRVGEKILRETHEKQQRRVREDIKRRQKQQKLWEEKYKAEENQ